MNRKVLARLSRLCPVCNLANALPRTGFARKVLEAERNCPLCLAYQEVYGRPRHYRVIEANKK